MERIPVVKWKYTSYSTPKARQAEGMSSALPKQNNNSQLQPLYQKTVVEEKKALVHFMWQGRGRDRDLSMLMLSSRWIGHEPAVLPIQCSDFFFLKEPWFKLLLFLLSPSAPRKMGVIFMLLLNWRKHCFFFSCVSNNCKELYILRKKTNKGPNKTEQCYCIFRKCFYRLIFRLLNVKETPLYFLK